MAEPDLHAAGDALPRPFEHCYWLLPGRILAGGHPSRDGRLAALQSAGVAHFVDLTGERDGLPVYAPSWARRSNFPIVDFGVPDTATMRGALDAIADALAQDRLSYLHCRAGIGRTGTVGACWLIEQGLAAEDALALLRRKFLASAQSFGGQLTPENDAQRAFVRAWRR